MLSREHEQKAIEPQHLMLQQSEARRSTLFSNEFDIDKTEDTGACDTYFHDGGDDQEDRETCRKWRKGHGAHFQLFHRRRGCQ